MQSKSLSDSSMAGHSIRHLISTLFAAFLWIGTAAGQVATPSQQDLLRMLNSDNDADRVSAVNWLSRLGPASAEPEVKSAVVAELQRNIALNAEARRQGIGMPPLLRGEQYFVLQEVVAQLNDPSTIPVLVQALGHGGLVGYLADYGEQAASAVLDLVTDPDSHHYPVGDGLRVLRMMVEGRADHPLSAQTMSRIHDAAEQLLSGPQYFTTVWWAIDLAAVLDDASLKQKLESIATNDAEVNALGIYEPELIVRTQQLAAERLAGIPAGPRREEVPPN